MTNRTKTTFARSGYELTSINYYITTSGRTKEAGYCMVHDDSDPRVKPSNESFRKVVSAGKVRLVVCDCSFHKFTHYRLEVDNVCAGEFD